MKKSTKRYSNSNEVFWGKEPESKDVDPLSPNFNAFISEALAWYNYSATSEKKKSWFIDWVKKNKPKANIEAIEQINDGAFTTAGSVARIHSRGLTESSYLNGKLAKWVIEFQEEGSAILREKEEKKINKKKTSYDPQLVYLFGIIDQVIDNFMTSGYKKTDFDMSDWIRLHNPSAAHLAAIREHWFPVLEELLNEEGDEQLAEAYSHLTDKQVEKFIELLLDIVTSKKVRKARTVRKPRAKSPDKMVKNVKFAVSDPETGVKSVEPKEIPGSSAVLIWNKKYRMLGLYLAESGKEISVKGSTILNFDEATSVWKKVRKPNEVVPKAVTSTKAQVSKIIDGLTSKPGKMNGRMNAETIILKVYTK